MAGARKKMKKIVMCLLMCSAPVYAASISHEETVVRTTYAKMAYAVQLKTIANLAMQAYQGKAVDRASAASAIDADTIKFDIRDVTVGNLADISSAKPTDFLSFPGDQSALRFASGGLNVDDMGNKSFLVWGSLRWGPAQIRLNDANGNIPLNEAISLDGSQIASTAVFRRYAAYTVTATYQGKTLGPYKALFAFGTTATGAEAVMPMDLMVEGLDFAIKQELQPRALLETHYRDIPLVSDWLIKGERIEPSCSPGKICCDAAPMQCGVPQPDVVKAFGKRLSPSPFLAPPKVAPAAPKASGIRYRASPVHALCGRERSESKTSGCNVTAQANEAA
jgi:hypothetical protein